ncbi:MAG: cupin domain-containing protein [Opitutales bacterium]|nr:cupin domain-containing protein [Opitutales bacterium]
MKKLALVIVGLGAVLQCAAAEEISSEVLVQTQTSWDGSALPAQNLKTPELTIVRTKIAQGAELALHKHQMINAGYLIKGSIEIISAEGKSTVLKAGECAVELVNKAHYGRNIGEGEAELILFYIGEKGTSRADIVK